MSSFWANKQVLVTGGTGFLGQAVCRVLNQQAPKLMVAPSRADYDLSDPGAAQSLLAETRPDVVIHLAARVGGIGANRERPADLYLENLLMGTNVIEQCRLAGTERLVVVGTICSYPEHTPVPFSEQSLWTGYPEKSNAPYGIAKLAQLVQLQANRDQYGQQGIYLMPTNLYGPGDKFHPSVSHVIPALIKKCVEAVEAGDDHIEVWGTGTASREFLYVDDAARGILLATEHYRGREPVNLGTNQEMPIKELVELVAEVAGFTGRVEWDTTKPDGQPRRCVDTGRARELFGFEASTPFTQGLRRTYQWYMANRQEAESRGRPEMVA
ncbi:GDP-L-fucose synthase family protein [Candidatus Poriferisocius sp.]|uniref:GDP-L-fucose synthase family protein n=1 Tax=Candidatus Poriferisocius sp. TaxID=3101276 RepID=UPI003B02A4FF